MIVQALATSFKVELLTAIHNFSTDTFKLALFRAQSLIVGNFGATTTNYSNMGADEATGTNYVAGGSALTAIAPTSSGTTAYTDFNDLTFVNVTIVASGALIYNSSKANRAVAVLNFGSDKTFTAQNMNILFPTADANTAIVRLV